MIKIGLTGGIGSGKSTVSFMLKEAGFEVVDADVIAKEVLVKYPEILEKVKIEFGSGFFDWRGEFRRKEFGNHIFRFPKQRKKYEEIILPYIKNEIKDEQMYYLLLDEVQFMPRFEEVLNSLLRISNIDIYVTGSNSKFLSSDIVTEFRGRGDEIRIYPLSFAEFYAAFGGDYDDAWNEYMI